MVKQMPYKPRKTIDQAEADWAAHAKAKADSWAKNVASDAAARKYIERISSFTGLSIDTVSRSYPVAGFKSFQTRAPTLVDNFRTGIDDAATAKRWSTKYKEAYSTPA
jgi:hypothetical protein